MVQVFIHLQRKNNFRLTRFHHPLRPTPTLYHQILYPSEQEESVCRNEADPGVKGHMGRVVVNRCINNQAEVQDVAILSRVNGAGPEWTGVKIIQSWIFTYLFKNYCDTW